MEILLQNNTLLTITYQLLGRNGITTKSPKMTRLNMKSKIIGYTPGLEMVFAFPSTRVILISCKKILLVLPLAIRCMGLPKLARKLMMLFLYWGPHNAISTFEFPFYFLDVALRFCCLRCFCHGIGVNGMLEL